MEILLREIREQPEVLVGSAEGLVGQTDALALAATWCSDVEHPLVLTGMGSSLDACQAAASLLGRRGRPAVAVNTAELVHFRLPSLLPGSCVIAVSQSGRSAELVRLGESLREVDDVRLVAITNGPDNALAGLADLGVDMNAGPEAGPATKTFTATLVALTGLVELLAAPELARPILQRTVSRATAAAQQATALLTDAEGLAARVEDWVGRRDHLVLVGRGVGRASAEVGALLLKEASKTAAECLDAAEFRHGPLELAGPSLAAVVVSLEPTTLELDRRLLRDLDARSSATLAVGLPDPLGVGPRLVVDPVHPLLDVALASLPLQLLAWSRTGGTGGDAFVVGAKVTTEE